MDASLSILCLRLCGDAQQAPRRCTDSLEPYRGPQRRAGFRYSGVIRPLLQRVNTPELPKFPGPPYT